MGEAELVLDLQLRRNGKAQFFFFKKKVVVGAISEVSLRIRLAHKNKSLRATTACGCGTVTSFPGLAGWEQAMRSQRNWLPEDSLRWVRKPLK